MKYPVYCIRDTKVGFDVQFLVQANEPAAVRAFSYMINNPQSIQNFCPSDFELYQISEFDTESGVMSGLTAPKFIVSGGSINEKS